jgi:hypothetical protein
VVRLASARETRPLWPRLAAASAGLAALIITTSVITAAAPSARTEASTVGSSLQAAPTHATAPLGTNPSSEHPASQSSTTPPDVTGPTTSTTSSASPPRDAGSDAGAPSTVAAVPTSATTIQLEWMPVDDATRYDIKRSIDNLTWEPVTSTDGGETTYTDADLSSGTTYYYRIVAFVDGQDASSSDAVSATTSGTPTSPVLVSATGSVTSIDLEWSDLDGALGYQIERSPDGTTAWIRIGTTGQYVTSYTDTGLASATAYSYRVVAVTPDGESPPSTVRSATTDAEAPAPSP